jgi:UDP-N-acetylglucosamine--N-acetylmuramyl-(pentapeptide) pyrophosphoryl-undecaprenol N-acetylglucosamine transferase
MIHEQNGVLGRVNRLFAPGSTAVACGTWPTSLPSGVEGMPIPATRCAPRSARAGAPYMPPGDWPMSLLVFGGSQGARLLSDGCPRRSRNCRGDLRDLRVAQQARPEDIERVERPMPRLDVARRGRPVLRRHARRLTEAQLVVARAGASSLADIAAIGRPAI